MERFLTLLAVLLAAFLAAGPSRAQAPQEGPMLLVASSKMVNAWSQTVLLVAKGPRRFHIGVIVNRPTELKLGSMFPEHEASRKVVEPVYFGGPAQPGMLVALVKGTPAPGPGVLPIEDGLALVLEAAAIDKVIETNPDSARFYVGVVIWKPGELEAEISGGAWTVSRCKQADLFSAEARNLWHRLAPANAGAHRTSFSR
jgi:putative transcriptional regulator